MVEITILVKETVQVANILPAFSFLTLFHVAPRIFKMIHEHSMTVKTALHQSLPDMVWVQDPAVMACEALWVYFPEVNPQFLRF